MLVSLTLSLVALRTGLRLRRTRLRKQPAPRGTRATHIRVAKISVVMLLVGFVSGPLSSYLLRGWTPFETFHGLAGGVAGVLFVATALRGRALELGPARGGANDPGTRDAHALFALAAVGMGAMAAFAGFVLTP
jgi:hypothetical protein